MYYINTYFISRVPLYDDETTTLFVPKVVDRLRDDDSINEILNRNIREL